jgi:transcription elongation factor Elf1
MTEDDKTLICPFCKEEIKTTLQFLKQNDRVCCMSCNKSHEHNYQDKLAYYEDYFYSID